MSYIGIIGAERIDQSLIEAHGEAKSMHRAGCSLVEIKRLTGWEPGIDRQWRYELPDPFYDTQTIEDYVKPRYGQPVNIPYIMHDHKLLAAYPEFERLRLFAMYHAKGGTAGYFNPNTYGMVVSMGTTKSPFDLQIEGILLHEIQHLIQDIENFAKGGSPLMGINRYRRLAGEVEARNICHRHSLTPERRTISLRTDTQDVPDSKQIILLTR